MYIAQWISDRLNETKLFLNECVRILTKPKEFFTELHSDGTWRRKIVWWNNSSGSSSTPRLAPARFLAYAIMLSPIVAYLNQTIMLARGFDERLIELARTRWADLGEQYNAMTGSNILWLDLVAPTGILFLDQPISDVTRFATYWLFSLLFWQVSGRRVDWRFLMVYFAYALGASRAWELLFGVPSALVIPNFSYDSGVTWPSLMVSLIGGAPWLAALFVLPSLIFPNLFPVTRRQMIRTTIVACFAWGIANYLLEILLFSNGLAIRLPRL